MSDPASRAGRLNRAIGDLLAQAPEVEAAAVVSFDGLPMASALPATMDEDRVAAMSAALLSLGERAAEGLGRGALSQVYIEGEHGTVFLVSADDEAVLVAVASRGAKVGMMLYEVRRAAEVVAEVLRAEAQTPVEPVAAQPIAQSVAAPVAEPEPVYASAYSAPAAHVEAAPEPVYAPAEPVSYAPVDATPAAPATAEPGWPAYLTTDTPAGTAEPTPWS
jgi:uncharacterized protein